MYLISGMHRSGTSLVARLFYEAGADMGDPTRFYPPDRWNPEGYYEQPAIHAVNMQLVNGPWWKLAYLRLPSRRTILRRAAHRAEQIRLTAAQYRDRVIKETRFCLTLPAWLAYGARVEALCICLRDPILVARSLQKRDRLPIRLGLKPWAPHNERLLEGCRDIPVRFVYYPHLLRGERFRGEIRPAFGLFGMEVSDETLETIQKAAVKPEMNHHPPEEYSYPAPVSELWQRLRARHAAQSAGTPDSPREVESE